MPSDQIRVRGARVHNLQGVDVDIPKNALVVVTGLSGSGKSSLAFDTLYAEGQRRYVESLSAYARQFLGLMHKPDVDAIEGLSPAISIEQKGLSHNPRSTVATVTEIYDYLRLLWARVGQPHCPRCDRPIAAQTVQAMVDRILAQPEGTRAVVLAPVIERRKGAFKQLFGDLRRQGFVRVRVDGQTCELEAEPELDKKLKHTIEVVVDRLVLRPAVRGRLTDSVELALRLAKGLMRVQLDEREELFSEHQACLHCDLALPELTPALFSFNAPQGACPACSGLGFRLEFDPALLVDDPELSIADGALRGWAGRPGNYYFQMLAAVFEHFGAALDTPWGALPERLRQVVLHGSGQEAIEFRLASERMEHNYRRPFEGVLPNMERRYRETTSDFIRGELARYQRQIPCEACGGTRLRPEARAVRVAGRGVHQVVALDIAAADAFVAGLALPGNQATIAAPILRELRQRLSFLADVGLRYLTLDRASASLSGGEAQRIRLATQIGSALTGVIYVLDEPSIGLHPRDNERLLGTLRRLRDLGNTVLVVEHDEGAIRAADHVIDLGPGAGRHGGRVVCAGTVADLVACRESLTGAFLAGREATPIPAQRRRPQPGRALVLTGARHNNLRDLTVELPLGLLVAVTGVSGSGKSSLVNDTLFPALRQRLNGAAAAAGPLGAMASLDGVALLDKVVDIDQSPIGRTPRSNPATYTHTFDLIRELFTALPESRSRGYQPGRYSFNVKGGRCEHCEGDGLLRIEMHFLPDVYVTCEVCGGKRYNRETLEILYRGKTIADVLEMTVEEALEFFAATPLLRARLATLRDVGLGYIHLGQSATTLSGGEAQRIKLARELGKRPTGRTIYLLDEPTTGLHFADVRNLIGVLQRLVDAGNSVVVIEHNLDVIASADHVLDLGPDGGDEGGRLVDAGPPEQLARRKLGHTGRYLAAHLKRPRAPHTPSPQERP